MKKILKVCLGCLIAMTMVACGGGNAQEEIVDEFFAQLAKGKSSKMEKLMTKGADDNVDLLAFMETMDVTFDADFGSKWDTQAKTFTEKVFKNVVESYEIDNVEEKGNDVVIKVKGKRLKYEEFFEDFDVMSGDVDEIIDSSSEIMDDFAAGDYTEEEYIKAVSDVYNDNAEAYFSEASKVFEDLKTTSFTITFTLQEEDDEWLIDEIDGTKEWPSFSEEEYEEDYDLGEEEYQTYEVDQNLCLPENTKLGKGNLLDTSKNEKDVETSLNFVDFNVKNAAGEEIDEYGNLAFTEPMTVEIEVLGNVGDTFYFDISDSDFNTINSEVITLTEEHMVITREITGINPDATDLYINLALEEYYGDQIGYFFIYKT